MPIDRTKAREMVAKYFARDLPYTSQSIISDIADLIDQAVKATALECSEICREKADRAPGDLSPVGVGARAAGTIRLRFGLKDAPYADLQCPREICQLCGGTGTVSGRSTPPEQAFICPRCNGAKP